MFVSGLILFGLLMLVSMKFDLYSVGVFGVLLMKYLRLLFGVFMFGSICLFGLIWLENGVYLKLVVCLNVILVLLMWNVDVYSDSLCCWKNVLVNELCLVLSMIDVVLCWNSVMFFE